MKRNVLITGGTGSIGKQLVASMAAEGHSVTFTTRSEAKGQEVLDSLHITEGRVSFVVIDFEEDKAADKLVDRMEAAPDAIIHNARNLDWIRPDEDGTIDARQWQGELFMALTFPYQLTQAALQKGTLKDVIFISSMYGVVAPTPSLYTEFERQSPINYGVAKAGQIHLTKEMAVRYASKNVRVNCVSYGGVEGRVNEDFKRKYASLNPAGRMLSTDDLYPPIQYLLNNETLPMTGENIKIDGGWTIW